MRGTPLAPDAEADPAAGDREPESIYKGHDGEEKEMQENHPAEYIVYNPEYEAPATYADDQDQNWPYVYCPDFGNKFIKYANPKKGDIVIFYRNGTFAHTGIVTKVSGDRFWTIEGNTSGASGIVANGGGVCEKAYYNSQLPGTKFCRPDYSIVTNIIPDNGSGDHTTGGHYMFEPKTVKKGDNGLSVLLLQEILIARGFKGKDGKPLTLDRTAGTNTIHALTQYQKSRKGVLEADGICGDKTWRDLIAL